MRSFNLTRVANVLLGVSALVACQAASAQAMYRIKPLGNLGGCNSSVPSIIGLNNADEVAGTACNANGHMHAFIWRNNGSGMVDLGPKESGSTSKAIAINASGLVAGSATDSTGSFAFESSGTTQGMTRIPITLKGSTINFTGMNDFGQLAGIGTMAGGNGPRLFFFANDGSPTQDLGNLPDEFGEGVVINASAQIAGTTGDAEGGAHAFVWKADGSPVLVLGDFGGTSTGACCINARGDVAGDSSLSGREHPHAFLWKNNGAGMKDLGTPPGGSQSIASALNDSGQVAGSWYVQFYQKQRAAVWMNNGTPMKDLGTLGGTTSQGNDIDASGRVTGWAYTSGNAEVHAFLWRNDGSKMQDLNALVDPTDPLKPYVSLTSGGFINDSGNILAYGTDSRTGRADLPYLLQGTVITLSPRSLAFGNQKINTSSAAKPVTVTNTSAKAVSITSVALTGSAAGQFAQTNTCGKSLAGHATCKINVTFKPTSKGAKAATINVNGGGGGLRTVSLTGTGSV